MLGVIPHRGVVLYLANLIQTHGFLALLMTFLNHICSSGDQSVLNGYLINTFLFCTNEITNAFWELQLQIVAQLRLTRSTFVVVAIVIPDLDGTVTRKFASGLERAC